MAKKKKKLRVRPGCLVSVFILVVSAVVLFLTPIFDIDDIVIKGNARISKAEIMIASGIREDKNIFAINKGYAKKKILAIGYIEDVKISRQLPGKVVITVKEGSVSAYLDFG
ncbi:MAG: FtsQ-type POTRA domain-containing protein, partial [Clostridia bacterium]|nr:FtsQ-type POTRA domain-containing protein [Clostridia bacterium]